MKSNKDGLGDRIKNNYENRAKHYLLRRTPVIIRVDGKAFHTFTRNMTKPFDNTLITVMRQAAIETAKKIQGCVAFYVASDEVSFLLSDWAQLDTCAWFDYNQSKIESVSAATMTAHFNLLWAAYPGNKHAVEVFDSRSFNLPKAEVANYFLWRMKDWERNSVTMLASDNFSHKQLQNVSTVARLQMMETIGVHWSAQSPHIRNGSFFIRREGTFVEKTLDESPTHEKISFLLKLLDGNTDVL